MPGRPGSIWTRFLPDRIAGQIALLVILSVCALHLVFFITVVWSRQDRGEHPAETTGRVAGFVRLLDVTPPAERAQVIARIRSSAPDLGIELPPAGSPAAPAVPDHRAMHLRRLLGEGFNVGEPTEASDRPGSDRVRIVIGLRDGTPAAVTLVRDRPPPAPGGPLRVTIIFVLVSLAMLGSWAALSLTKPLRAIEATVESYGFGQTVQPLSESGPREIRTVARALNRMQERITKLVDDRTKTLAAVGHDLRTPITRLRLRAEMLDESPERSRMLADLDQMDALVQSALTHLRDGRSDAASTTFDLQSLLQTIADGYADVGKPVTMQVSARLPVRGRPFDVERAVANVVDNAIKYGGTAELSLSREGSMAVIAVADKGPGIPLARRAAMLEPFVRGEDARTMNDTDGFGLGLTIARSVMEAHGGTIAFADNSPSGLIVKLSLPVS
ncbi:ATP-binding protein [Phreatobacter cathodiphilus]|nr:ATP-binding protein [Phreatobacter cathodiphilus]